MSWRTEFDGASYRLDHLSASVRGFDWRCKDGAIRRFSCRLRYSDHCFTVESKDPATRHLAKFGSKARPRVFDLDRYKWSLELPLIFDALFQQPTRTVRATHERNVYLFKTRMSHPMAAGEKYYCFFTTRRGRFSSPAAQTNLDLFVQSAYARTVTPAGKQVMPFGRLAERVALNEVGRR